MHRLRAILITALLVGCPAAAWAERGAPYPMQDFVMVPRGLPTAVVADANGRAVGIVSAISTGHSGRPLALGILMADGRRVTILSGSLTYDPVANRVMLAAESPVQIAAR